MARTFPRLAAVLTLLLLCAGSTSCDLVDKYKEYKELKAKNAEMQGRLDALGDQLTKAQAQILDLEARKEELATQMEKNAFQAEEYERTFQRYRDLETTNSTLQKRVAELTDTVKTQEETLRKLQAELKQALACIPKENPVQPRFHVDECVQWYGSVYTSRHKMRGTVVKVRRNKTYLVRCTESTMPYMWAENELYELSQETLEPCEEPVPMQQEGGGE
jgi:seryl-tRNA synthetase